MSLPHSTYSNGGAMYSNGGTHIMLQFERRRCQWTVIRLLVMVMFCLLCGRITHPFGHRRGVDPTQMASNMPQWNQAHRAHQQTKDGSSISNSLAHCEVRTIFQKKSEAARQSRCSYQHASNKTHITTSDHAQFHLRKSSSITIPLVGSASPRVQSKIHFTASDETRNCTSGNAVT